MRRTIKTAFFQGKVRDIYDLEDRLLLVASDRISAYDCILPDPIPFKGKILTALSLFWFERLEKICQTHFISADEGDFPDVGADLNYLRGRSMLVKKAEVIPVECIVRGYLAGSAWQEYKNSGTVSGIKLPSGMRDSEELPEPVFTPSTKAVTGHDENITEDEVTVKIGAELTGELRRLSLAIYNEAASYAAGRGIIIADTKFEFGRLGRETILIDEVLTPDSSRFWPADSYRAGRSQPSFDKQFVRDYLDSVGWDHQPPAPRLPKEIITKTSAKYIEAYERLTGERFREK